MKTNKRILLTLIAALAVVLTAPLAVHGRAARNKSLAKLPPVVARVVQENRPGAEIGKLEIEKEGGITLYDIEFKAGMGEIEVAEDGTVMDIATIIEMKDLPAPAAAAIQRAAAGARIKQIEKSEVRAEIQMEGKKGKIVKLASYKHVYEAELVRANKSGEVQVDAEGKIVEGPKWGR